MDSVYDRFTVSENVTFVCEACGQTMRAGDAAVENQNGNIYQAACFEQMNEQEV